MLAFGGVTGREFPILVRIVDACEKAALLFLFGNVKEEFADDDPIAREVSLGVTNVFEAFFPDSFGNEFGWNFLPREQFGVDAHDENVFVVAAVEYADVAAIGQDLEATPKVVVIEFLGGRRLEGIDLATLRIDAGHDVFDGTVLAGGVHGLEDEEQGPFVLGIEPVLEIAEEFDAAGEGFFGAGLIFITELQCVAGIEIFQVKLFAVINPEWVGYLLRSFD
jgi:hypothetical protein